MNGWIAFPRTKREQIVAQSRGWPADVDPTLPSRSEARRTHDMLAVHHHLISFALPLPLGLALII